MWRIIQFFTRFGNLILFLSLEFIALFLVISLNQDQKQLFEKFSLEVSAGIHEVNDGIYGYFNLRNENDKLQDQNRLLEIKRLKYENKITLLQNRFPDSLKFTIIPDTLFPAERFDFLPSRAINNTTDRNYNYITLDKGTKHGAEKGMGIISPEGIAGQVIGVSSNYSIGLSVLNKKFKLSCRVLKNRNIGSLSWKGDADHLASLEYIPRTSPLKVGDTVVTSGFSTIFPENFMVGTIESFDEDSHDGFYNIKVKLATDYRSLDVLYMVKNVHKAEIDSLTQAIVTE